MGSEMCIRDRGVDEEETEDDGFLEALKGEVSGVWEEE